MPPFNNAFGAMAGVTPWVERQACVNRRVPVRFPVRACAWVVGQMPGGGRVRGNRLMILSLPTPPHSLEMNK